MAPCAAAAKIVTGRVAKITNRQILRRTRDLKNPDIAEKIGATGAMIQPATDGIRELFKNGITPAPVFCGLRRRSCFGARGDPRRVLRWLLQLDRAKEFLIGR